MLQQKTRLFIIFFINGFFLFIDQLLKYFARNYPNTQVGLNSWLGWEYFKNTGIAFSIPFPNLILLIFTPPIIFALSYFIYKQKKTNLFFPTSLIVSGALSNYLDRLIFGFTIDYLRVFTSVINLADIFIFIGILFLLIKNKNIKAKKHQKGDHL